MSPKILIAVALVLILAGAAGYREFLAPGKGSTQSVADPAGWEIRYFSGRSKLLRRPTLQVIVLSNKRFASKDNGRVVEIGNQSVGGIGRMFILGDGGQLTEATSHVFKTLWDQREGLEAKISAPENRKSRDNWVRDYLRSIRSPEDPDTVLKMFLEDPRK
jgi:hypothetical protein